MGSQSPRATGTGRSVVEGHVTTTTRREHAARASDRLKTWLLGDLRQGGAYATGVLVLMSSAGVAATLSARRRASRRWRAYASITLVFAYATVVNVIERPDGVRVASFFILAIVTTSLVSRATRSTELRVTAVQLDPLAPA
jgi:hypothetical protein